MANMETAEQTLGPITVPVLVNSVAIEPNTPLLRYKKKAPAAQAFKGIKVLAGAEADVANKRQKKA